MVDRSQTRKEHLRLKKTVAVTSGSGNTTFVLNKPISHLLIQAPNESDTFTAKLLDDQDDRMTKDMKAYSDDDGLLSTIWEKNIPTIGEFTVDISGGSSDGDYIVTVMYPNL